MTDEQLTALAERFCATPLPDSVCADLVAIKPMAGRYGTNLMTVAQAKEMLAAVLLPTCKWCPDGSGWYTSYNGGVAHWRHCDYCNADAVTKPDPRIATPAPAVDAMGKSTAIAAGERKTFSDGYQLGFMAAKHPFHVPDEDTAWASRDAMKAKGHIRQYSAADTAIAAKYADMSTAERAVAMADDGEGDPWELLGYFREKLRHSEINAEEAKVAATDLAIRLRDAKAAATKAASQLAVDAVPAGEVEALASAVGYAGAVLRSHADKLPLPQHARNLADRCAEASNVLAALSHGEGRK